jgi:hypothetical protein
MLAHGHDHKDTQESVNEKEEWTGPTWTEKEMNTYIERKGACALLMDGYIVDVTEYAKTHVRLRFLSKCRTCALTSELLLAWRRGPVASLCYPSKG